MNEKTTENTQIKCRKNNWTQTLVQQQYKRNNMTLTDFEGFFFIYFFERISISIVIK